MPVIKFRNMETGQALPVPYGDFTVGRSESSDIQIDHPSISRRHAKLTHSDLGVFIEDLGSANGTAAHGAFVTGRVPLQVSDLIHLGTVPFRIDPEVPEAGSPPEPEPQPIILPSRTRLSRDTERIARVVAPVPADQLAAPVVSSSSEDADQLNAVQFREPATPSIVPPSRVRPVEETPFPIPSPRPSETPAAGAPSVAVAPRVTPTEEEDESSAGTTTGYWIIFALGLAVGILAGIFIDRYLLLK